MLPHEATKTAKSCTNQHEHTPVARVVKEHNVIVLMLGQLDCLEMGHSLRFLEKKDSKFTTLQKKDVILIINKYKLLNAIFQKNNK